MAPPGAVAAASQTACIGPVPPQATLLLVLQAAGQTINLPAYIIPTSGAQTALGAAQLVFCLPPPDLPAPVGATFGAKFLSADLTLNGVIGPIAQGAWVAFWTPWNAGVGTVNTAASVVSPASPSVTSTTRPSSVSSVRTVRGPRPVTSATIPAISARSWPTTRPGVGSASGSRCDCTSHTSGAARRICCSTSSASACAEARSSSPGSFRCSDTSIPAGVSMRLTLWSSRTRETVIAAARTRSRSSASCPAGSTWTTTSLPGRTRWTASSTRSAAAWP